MTEQTIDDIGWDSLCKQCGRCCYEKLEDGRGKIIYTQTPCEYLDVDSCRCIIFEQRFIINPSCIKLTPELVATLPWLPPDCGYRPVPDRFTRKTSRGRIKRSS